MPTPSLYPVFTKAGGEAAVLVSEFIVALEAQPTVELDTDTTITLGEPSIQVVVNEDIEIEVE